MTKEVDEMSAGARGSVANGWIPVTERLPDVDELVIVCVSGDYVTPLRRHNQDGFWQHEDGDIDLINVTHWMPLPAPPTDAE